MDTKKFLIKYFDNSINNWAILEKSSPKDVTNALEKIGLIPWHQLFVYEIEEDRILRKWGIGLIEEDNLND